MIMGLILTYVHIILFSKLYNLNRVIIKEIIYTVPAYKPNLLYYLL